MASVVYCLTNGDESHTYVGVTNDLTRRMRQHNGTLTGGARYTRNMKKHTSLDWRLLYVIIGLPDRRTALQLEWRLHRRASASRQNPFGTTPAARRAWQLQRALQLPRVTATAPQNIDLEAIIMWRDSFYHRVASRQQWPIGIKHQTAARQ
jgi:structure-specific endonuclease subunit SLX1